MESYPIPGQAPLTKKKKRIPPYSFRPLDPLMYAIGFDDIWIRHTGQQRYIVGEAQPEMNDGVLDDGVQLGITVRAPPSSQLSEKRDFDQAFFSAFLLLFLIWSHMLLLSICVFSIILINS